MRARSQGVVIIRARVLIVSLALLVVPSLAAAGSVAQNERFLRSIDRMMVALGPHNARSSTTIKEVYRPHLEVFRLDGYASLEEAISTGAVVPLPADPARFGIEPRVTGRFPIGEKDLSNQVSYIAARPAAVGALLEVASRVTSGPLEVTSLVRHAEYQRALRRTNPNAATSVPMHTLGLAFDISLINTPLPTIYELRDVLRRMQADGDVLFIGERRQLVFHVVPHPRRLGHFAGVYARALAESMPGANVIGATTIRPETPIVPDVRYEIAALRPADEVADTWWATDIGRGDLAVLVRPVPAPAAAMPLEDLPRGPMGSAASLLLASGLLAAVLLTRPAGVAAAGARQE